MNEKYGIYGILTAMILGVFSFLAVMTVNNSNAIAAAEEKNNSLSQRLTRIESNLDWMRDNWPTR